MRLLCVDGGGIKGLIPAQIIYRIEQSVEEGGIGINVREYFDMFAGTSAGSMIVAAMVYGNATGEDLVKKLLPNKRAKEIMHQGIMDKIFGQMQLRPKYDGASKRKLIKENVNNKTLDQTDKFVMLPSYNINMKRTRFFKSWEPQNKGIPVLDIVDASSAAPSFYPSVKINCDNGSSCFVDGAISVNNPTDSAYADMLEMVEGTHRENEHMQILSLGTGYTKVSEKDLGRNVRNWGGIQWATEGDIFQVLMTGPEAVVDYRSKRFADALNHDYLRIQGDLDNGSLDDTSDTNLAELRAKGDKWFEENKENLKSFFSGI